MDAGKSSISMSIKKPLGKYPIIGLRGDHYA